VIDLTSPTPYQLSRDAGAVVIYFDVQPRTLRCPANSTTLALETRCRARNSVYTEATPSSDGPFVEQFADFRSSLQLA